MSLLNAPTAPFSLQGMNVRMTWKRKFMNPKALEDLDDYEGDTKCIGYIKVISPHGNLHEDATDVPRLIVVRCAQGRSQEFILGWARISSDGKRKFY